MDSLHLSHFMFIVWKRDGESSKVEIRVICWYCLNSVKLLSEYWAFPVISKARWYASEKSFNVHRNVQSECFDVDVVQLLVSLFLEFLGAWCRSSRLTSCIHCRTLLQQRLRYFLAHCTKTSSSCSAWTCCQSYLVLVSVIVSHCRSFVCETVVRTRQSYGCKWQVQWLNAMCRSAIAQLLIVFCEILFLSATVKVICCTVLCI